MKKRPHIDSSAAPAASTASDHESEKWNMPTPDDLELPKELHGLEAFVLEEAERMVERSGVPPTNSAYREAIEVVVYGARVRIAEAEAINALAG